MNDPRLTAYVLGELQGAELKEVETLIRGSASAQREVEKIRRMTGRLREELGVPPLSRSDSSWGQWRGIFSAMLALGIGVAVATWVLFPSGGIKEGPPRTAHVLLDPPVNTNSELNTDQWTLNAPAEALIVSGGMDKAGIYATIKGGLPALRNCYEAHAPKEAPGGNTERFEWSVRADGRYGKMAPIKEQHDKVLAECLTTSLSVWHFPRGKIGKVQFSFAVQKRR